MGVSCTDKFVRKAIGTKSITGKMVDFDCVERTSPVDQMATLDTIHGSE